MRPTHCHAHDVPLPSRSSRPDLKAHLAHDHACGSSVFPQHWVSAHARLQSCHVNVSANNLQFTCARLKPHQLLPSAPHANIAHAFKRQAYPSTGLGHDVLTPASSMRVGSLRCFPTLAASCQTPHACSHWLDATLSTSVFALGPGDCPRSSSSVCMLYEACLHDPWWPLWPLPVAESPSLSNRRPSVTSAAAIPMAV